MELIIKPVYLPSTPSVIIKSIDSHIVAFNRWAVTPGHREFELPGWKKHIEAEILLGTEKEMGAAWANLKDLERPGTDLDFDEPAYGFYCAIQKALYGESAWAELPPTGRERKHEDIIRSMRRLARDIQYYDLDQSENVAHEGKPCAGGFVVYEDGTPDEFTSFQNLYINKTGIQISDLLQKHADKLEEQKRYQEPLTKQTKGHNKGLLHFIRSLAVYNTSRYGRSHAAIISKVAFIYFPNLETDQPSISSSIRGLNL